MLPLKPPALKKVCRKDIKLVNFPVYDDNHESIYKNSSPAYHGVFDGKVVIIKDSNEISRLTAMGSYGQLGMFENNSFVDYKTLQNQVLNQKKNWQAMELVPFEFPINNYEYSKDESDGMKSLDQGDPKPFEFSREYSKDESDGMKSLDQGDPKPFEFSREYSKDENDGMKSLDQGDPKPFEFSREYSKDESDRMKSLDQGDPKPFEFSSTKNKSVENSDDHVERSLPPSNWNELKTIGSKKYDELLILSGQEHHMPYFLLLEEAFFLCYTLECLEIKNEKGSIINVLECWELFNESKTNFSFLYAAYHYYRSKGWAVKLGQQYGGDFVLYKTSPVYYHSSYVVVININGQNSELLTSWPTWFGCNRAVEAASKELLICAVFGPVYKKGMPVDLTQYTVNDIIVRRWVPSQNRKHHKYED